MEFIAEARYVVKDKKFSRTYFWDDNKGFVTKTIELKGVPVAIQVFIPSVLIKLTGGQSEISSKGSTIREVIDNMNREYPGIKDRLFEKDKFNPRLNYFVNQEDVRFLQAEDTPVKDGDEVSIVPAIAGGAV